MITDLRRVKHGTIYLLHFAKPYHHARHYLGWAVNADDRFQQHMSGGGSPLVKAVVESGIGVKIVRTWDGTRDDERALKNRKNSTKLCPLCVSQEGS